MGLIIDNRGEIVNGWIRANGPAIFDPAANNRFGIDFHIGVYYTDDEAAKFHEIRELKHYLDSTDWRALKYADGAYTEEEYAPYKQARANARARINEIESTFIEPTLTRAEIDAAETVAMENLKGAE